MKVYVLADLKSDWYPKNAVETFGRYSSWEFVGSPGEADIAWIFSYGLSLEPQRRGIRGRLLSPRRWLGNGRHNGSQLVVSSFHHLYRPKECHYLGRLKRTEAASHAVHFFSAKNAQDSQDYFRLPILVLPYWIDTGRFRPLATEERLLARQAFGIPPDRRVIGSFQRDTEADLTSPKAEKGPDLFCDVVESLDPEAHFVLLAGPRRDYVERRLSQVKVPFLSLGQVPFVQMNRLYNCLDCYLVTSRVEGGPQAILEAMATRTPIYSTPVGVSNMLAGKVVLSSPSEFVAALTGGYPDVLDQHFQAVQELEPRRVVNQYEETFGAMYEAYRGHGKSFYYHLPQIRWYNVDSSNIKTRTSGANP